MRSLAKAVSSSDPSRMKTQRNKYVGKFSKLFIRFRVSFIKLFKEYTTTPLDPERIDAFNGRTKALLNTEISVPGKGIIDDYVSISYASGQSRAAQFLKPFGIDAAVGNTPADEDVLKILRQRNYTALGGITDDMSKTITREITDGVLNGESVPKISKRLREKVGMSKTRAETFAQTEVMYSYNTAARAQYERYGLTEVQWLTSNDGRVCSLCAPLHGKIFKMGEAPPIPRHPNCRCVLLPVIGDRNAV